MKIRMHRGSLADSLATMQEIEPTAEAILAYLGEESGKLRVQTYVDTPDHRIHWPKTYLVIVDEQVRAFTDEPIKLDIPEELITWTEQFVQTNPGYTLTDVWSTETSHTFRFYNQSLNHEERITLDKDINQ